MKVSPLPESGHLPDLHLVGHWSHAARRALLKSAVWLSLKATPRAVYNTLWLYSDTSGKPVFPSHKRLAEAVGVDPSTIKRAIRALESAGLVERVAEFTGEGDERRQTSNRYLLPLPLGSAVTPPQVIRDLPQGSGTEKLRSSKKVARVPVGSPPGRLATVSIPTQEDKTVKKIRTDTSETLFREDPREGTDRSPGIPDQRPAKVRIQRPPRAEAVAADVVRLDDTAAWDARGLRSPPGALLDYYLAKRAQAEPDVLPPAKSGILAGQAGHLVKRFWVGEVSGLDAFRKARRVVDAAFARECWPFKGESSPVELSSLAHRAVFDRLRAHLGERINGPPPVLTPDERRLAWLAANDEENVRNGFASRLKVAG